MNTSRGWKKIASRRTPPEEPPRKRSVLRARASGLLLLSFGLFLLYHERTTIVRTGHGGRKSAVVPFLIFVSLGLALDPETRRPGITAALFLLGTAASVAWFLLWG